MIPLSGWANRQLVALAKASAFPEIAKLTGGGILAERARLNGFTIPGAVSAGGGCRMLATQDGSIALNLSRPEDRDLLPALLEAEIDAGDDEAVAAQAALNLSDPLVARGREMGMAIASLSEDRSDASPAFEHRLPCKVTRQTRAPKVVDLSALWAGPLAGRLFGMAGAQVTKIESSARPDSMREGDPALFERLNSGKHHLSLGLHSDDGLAELRARIADADIVIEAARPRALLQLGIDADNLVQARPGLIWLSITGHGTSGDAANWVAFGDDASVSGGLSAALYAATGATAFVGDAIADPLTGLLAARTGWDAWCTGQGGRFVFSMSGVAATALAEEMGHDPAGLKQDLQHWHDCRGDPFPS